MNKRLLLGSLVLLSAACRQEGDITPTLASEAVGQYATNGFLDFRCIALPADQMPSAVLSPRPDGRLTLTFRTEGATPQSRALGVVDLRQQADETVSLLSNGASIGTLRRDRVFTASGMEKQGLVLQLSLPSNRPQDSLFFTGYKQ